VISVKANLSLCFELWAS